MLPLIIDISLAAIFGSFGRGECGRAVRQVFVEALGRAALHLVHACGGGGEPRVGAVGDVILARLADVVVLDRRDERRRHLLGLRVVDVPGHETPNAQPGDGDDDDDNEKFQNTFRV